MQFEWDPTKAKKNFVKHGVFFDDAIQCFDDPFGRVEIDFAHSEIETREKRIGQANCGLVVVIFTMRENGEICRIISARKANREEKTLYETFKQFQF